MSADAEHRRRPIASSEWASGGQDPEAATLQIRGRDLSFEPRTGALRPESGGSQFGMTFDEWGSKFESLPTARRSKWSCTRTDISPAIRSWRPRGPHSRLGRRQRRLPHRARRTMAGCPYRDAREGAFSGPVEGGGKPPGTSLRLAE